MDVYGAEKYVVKEVMQKIKFPTRFCANLKNIITNKGGFRWLKTHDWNVFIKVIALREAR